MLTDWGGRELGRRRRMEKRGPLPPPNLKPADLGHISLTGVGKGSFVNRVLSGEPGQAGEGLRWREQWALRIDGGPWIGRAQLLPTSAQS